MHEIVTEYHDARMDNPDAMAWIEAIRNTMPADEAANTAQQPTREGIAGRQAEPAHGEDIFSFDGTPGVYSVTERVPSGEIYTSA